MKREKNITLNQELTNLSNDTLIRKKMNALDRFEAKFGLTNDTLLERSKLLVALEEFSSAKTILIDLIKSYKSPEVILLLSKCFSASDNIEETSKFKNILEENIKL